MVKNLTPVLMGANGAQRSWRPVDHIVRAITVPQTPTAFHAVPSQFGRYTHPQLMYAL